MSDPLDSPVAVVPETPRPLFSALLSVYDGEQPAFLQQCFESLASQSWPADDIVVVLDGPVRPELMTVVEHWREQLPMQVVALPENRGLGLALNAGLQACRYDWVARVDTDDISQPWRFERQIGFLMQHPHLDLCGSHLWEIDAATDAPMGQRRVPESAAAIRALLPYRNPFNHPTMVMRRSRVLDVGGYPDERHAEDYHLWIALLAQGAQGWNLQDDLVVARAGMAHLGRRRGRSYLRAEWHLYRAKRRWRITSLVGGFFVFCVRAAPRLLPPGLLAPFYRLLRRR